MTRRFHRLEARALHAAGPDARSWLQGQITANLDALSAGPVYTLILTPSGKIVSDAWIVEDGGGLTLILPAPAFDDARQRLQQYLVMEDVTLEELDAAVTHVLGEEPPGGRAWPTTRLGRPGWDVLGAPADLAELCAGWDELRETDWERARITAGIPRWGRDFGLDTLPQEAGLTHAVSFDKGCYIGQEPVVMLRDRGKPPKRLAQVRLPETDDAEIRAGDRVVGRVTSRAGDRGLALIKRKALEAGPLQIGGRPLEVLAVVGETP